MESVATRFEGRPPRLSSIRFVDQSKRHIHQGGHVAVWANAASNQPKVLTSRHALVLTRPQTSCRLQADGYGNNGILLEIVASPGQGPSSRVVFSLIVQLIATTVSPANAVELKVAPRCPMLCCARCLDIPVAVSATGNQRTDAPLVSHSPNNEVSICLRVMELPQHVNFSHFNLLIRAVERRAPSSSDMAVSMPITFVSANFIVHERTKPIRWMHLKTKADADDIPASSNKIVYPPDVTFATIKTHPPTTPSYLFMLNFLDACMQRVFPDDTPPRVVEALISAKDELWSVPADLAGKLTSFCDVAEFILEQVGTESTDDVQSVLQKLFETIGSNIPNGLEVLYRFQDFNGMSLLHQAAAVGYLKTAAFALQHGAEPNIVDRDGNSPLHYAAEGGFKNLAQLLIQRGAKVDQNNLFEETPLSLSTREKKFVMKDILIKPRDIALAVVTPLVLPTTTTTSPSPVSPTSSGASSTNTKEMVELKTPISPSPRRPASISFATPPSVGTTYSSSDSGDHADHISVISKSDRLTMHSSSPSIFPAKAHNAATPAPTSDSTALEAPSSSVNTTPPKSVLKSPISSPQSSPRSRPNSPPLPTSTTTAIVPSTTTPSSPPPSFPSLSTSNHIPITHGGSTGSQATATFADKPTATPSSSGSRPYSKIDGHVRNRSHSGSPSSEKHSHASSNGGGLSSHVGSSPGHAPLVSSQSTSAIAGVAPAPLSLSPTHQNNQNQSLTASSGAYSTGNMSATPSPTPSADSIPAGSISLVDSPSGKSTDKPSKSSGFGSFLSRLSSKEPKEPKEHKDPGSKQDRDSKEDMKSRQGSTSSLSAASPPGTSAPGTPTISPNQPSTPPQHSVGAGDSPSGVLSLLSRSKKDKEKDKEREKRERLEKEKLEKIERERKDREKQERLEKEKIEKAERERLKLEKEREKKEREKQKEREKAERLMREKEQKLREKLDKDRLKLLEKLEKQEKVRAKEHKQREKQKAKEQAKQQAAKTEKPALPATGANATGQQRRSHTRKQSGDAVAPWSSSFAAADRHRTNSRGRNPTSRLTPEDGISGEGDSPVRRRRKHAHRRSTSAPTSGPGIITRSMSVEVLNYLNSQIRQIPKREVSIDWTGIIVYTDHIQDVARRYNIAPLNSVRDKGDSFVITSLTTSMDVQQRIPRKWRSVFARVGITDKELALTSAMLADLKRWSPLINFDELDRLHRELRHRSPALGTRRATISADLPTVVVEEQRSSPDTNYNATPCANNTTSSIVLSSVAGAQTTTNRADEGETSPRLSDATPPSPNASAPEQPTEPTTNKLNDVSIPNEEAQQPRKPEAKDEATSQLRIPQLTPYVPIDPAAAIRKELEVQFVGTGVDLQFDDPRFHYHIVQPVDCSDGMAFLGFSPQSPMDALELHRTSAATVNPANINYYYSLVSNLNHPVLVKCSDVHVVGDAFWTVREFIGGINLQRLLRLRTLPIPEEVVAFICKEMLSAVVYMHVEKQAVLGNIVPKTILISDSAQIRFSDFTHSYASSNIAPRTDDNQSVLQSTSFDYICVGFLAAQMVLREHGLWDVSAQIMYAKRATLRLELLRRCSKDLFSFVSTCIDKSNVPSNIVSHSFLDKACSREAFGKFLRTVERHPHPEPAIRFGILASAPWLSLPHDDLSDEMPPSSSMTASTSSFAPRSVTIASS